MKSWDSMLCTLREIRKDQPPFCSHPHSRRMFPLFYLVDVLFWGKFNRGHCTKNCSSQHKTDRDFHKSSSRKRKKQASKTFFLINTSSDDKLAMLQKYQFIALQGVIAHFSTSVHPNCKIPTVKFFSIFS